ncbi:hypothetical protein [Lentilactobacillus sunkii]|uniref:Uncharacterized protein n=1 Tax=Lentilactobacillus sunkii DSM 19904 TaxID=1423808 RepID=A0A0R1KVN5_9LACO|nr:hypothetical protein [Lentilactobacillus sunkii]KRK87579.1 hypothetical protein FD17_GL000978 [Lentilactobacillus sunkii DSM 19904]
MAMYFKGQKVAPFFNGQKIDSVYYKGTKVFAGSIPVGTVLWKSSDSRGQAFGGQITNTYVDVAIKKMVSKETTITVKYPVERLPHGIRVQGINYINGTGWIDHMNTGSNPDVYGTDFKIPKEKLNDFSTVSSKSPGNEFQIKYTNNVIDFGSMGTLVAATKNNDNDDKQWSLIQSITAY